MVSTPDASACSTRMYVYRNSTTRTSSNKTAHAEPGRHAASDSKGKVEALRKRTIPDVPGPAVVHVHRRQSRHVSWNLLCTGQEFCSRAYTKEHGAESFSHESQHKSCGRHLRLMRILWCNFPAARGSVDEDRQARPSALRSPLCC